MHVTATSIIPTYLYQTFLCLLLKAMKTIANIPLLILQGLTSGVENDHNAANLQPPELPHKRLSNSSTTSNQSYDSTVEYAVPKHSYNRTGGSLRASELSDNSDLGYGQQKITNPLFGVNAASHYAPGSITASQHEAVNDQTKHYERTSLPNGVRKAPEGQDNDVIKNEDALDGRKEVIVSPNQIAITEGGTATYTTDNNGKINVHVTVMINAGNYMHPYELKLTVTAHLIYIHTYIAQFITYL